MNEATAMRPRMTWRMQLFFYLWLFCILLPGREGASVEGVTSPTAISDNPIGVATASSSNLAAITRTATSIQGKALLASSTSMPLQCCNPACPACVRGGDIDGGNASCPGGRCPCLGCTCCYTVTILSIFTQSCTTITTTTIPATTTATFTTFTGTLLTTTRQFTFLILNTIIFTESTTFTVTASETQTQTSIVITLQTSTSTVIADLSTVTTTATAQVTSEINTGATVTITDTISVQSSLMATGLLQASMTETVQDPASLFTAFTTVLHYLTVPTLILGRMAQSRVALADTVLVPLAMVDPLTVVSASDTLTVSSGTQVETINATAEPPLTIDHTLTIPAGTVSDVGGTTRSLTVDLTTRTVTQVTTAFTFL